MKTAGTCRIDKTMAALEEALENKKIQLRNERDQRGPVIPYVFSEILNRAGGSYGQIHQLLDHGRGFARDFIQKAQENVQENPWEALRKVAAYSFGVGLFLSLKHRKPTGGEE